MFETLKRQVVVRNNKQLGINLPTGWAREQGIKAKQPIALLLKDGFFVVIVLGDNVPDESLVTQVSAYIDKKLREVA